MANLTNSGKLISKITGIEDLIGEVPSGSNVMAEIGSVDSDLQGYKTTVSETYATKSEISSVFNYKGTKASYSQLPTTGNVKGDVWNITAADPDHDIKAGDNVVWDGTAWDVLSGVVDLSGYYDTSAINTMTGLASASAGFTSTALSVDSTTKQMSASDTTDSQSIDAAQDANVAALKAIKDAYNALETRVDSAESGISNVYTKTEVNTITGLNAASAGFVSNTVSEAALTGVVTVTAADNVSIATAETNNKSAIDALGTAHNNLVSRVAAVESATGSLPFEAKYIDVTFNASKTAVVSDAFITASTSVDTWVVTNGTPASYAYEYEVEAGKVTFTASNDESITMRVRLSKEISA